MLLQIPLPDPSSGLRARGSAGYPGYGATSDGGTLACGSGGACSAVVSVADSPPPLLVNNHRRGACTVATMAAVDRARWGAFDPPSCSKQHYVFSCMIFRALLKRILILVQGWLE
jgi:hypothetical protein